MPGKEKLRNAMVDRQIAARGISDGNVLSAMREVPREAFVPERLGEFAYDDAALPIEEGQTISQPYIVALMIEAARLSPGDRVLEIGAGSGYAAAVMGQVAAVVHAIERHDALAKAAAARIARLDYGNVHVINGDGTNGLPDEAPFDAILVAAGGPAIPQPLCSQLAIGGRLIIPIGNAEEQRLVRVIRTGEDDYQQDDLGPVRFVPLIGAHGWQGNGGAMEEGRSVPRIIAAAAEPLPDFDDPAFGALFDRFADARIVLIGEASHGTSEFYRARAAITRRLIEHHGFTIIAVEADWPDAAAIDRHVRHRPARREDERIFQRFPTWMWRNTDVDDFIGWLRAHNEGLPDDRQTGFHGLDLYSLNSSVRAVIGYLDRVDPEAAAIARERYGCLTPWRNDPAAYGRMAISTGYAQCEQAVVQQLRDLFSRSRATQDGEDLLDARQNARLVANAESYYRAIYYGGAESWNLGDTHMFDTLELLLQQKGARAKAVVWAHNSHIGDARHTEMGSVRDEINIGQLCREHYGDNACLIGLGTHGGTVAAATDWDGPMEVKRVNPSRPDSYERLCHDSGVDRFLIDLREGRNEAARAALIEPRLERFIGVIYRPETERWSHYSTADLPRQFDAWLWFDETQAVTPSGDVAPQPGEEETYPFGL